MKQMAAVKWNLTSHTMTQEYRWNREIQQWAARRQRGYLQMRWSEDLRRIANNKTTRDN